MYSREQDKQFEKAIIFVTKAMESCHNSKPVLLHSLRVAFLLYAENYEIDICIAALFHDLLEDTATEASDIEEVFGEKISKLVSLLTMDVNINDYQEQYLENFTRCENNKNALVIRCADFLDNAQYLHLAEQNVQYNVREKQIYFYDKFEKTLKDEPIWKKFEQYIKEISGER